MLWELGTILAVESGDVVFFSSKHITHSVTEYTGRSVLLTTGSILPLLDLTHARSLNAAFFYTGTRFSLVLFTSKQVWDGAVDTPPRRDKTHRLERDSVMMHEGNNHLELGDSSFELSNIGVPYHEWATEVERIRAAAGSNNNNNNNNNNNTTSRTRAGRGTTAPAGVSGNDDRNENSSRLRPRKRPRNGNSVPPKNVCG